MHASRFLKPKQTSAPAKSSTTGIVVPSAYSSHSGIHVSEKFGHNVENFNPHCADGDTLTWAIKCYFGWSERDAYRDREGSSSSELTGGGWNTHASEPESGQQRRSDTGEHQVFTDGYWVSFDEYREQVPAMAREDLPWDLDEDEQ